MVTSPPMPVRTRHIVTTLALSLAGFALTGCSTVNERLSAGVSDAIPAWAGGIPADAPPRPGTAKYDEFMKERERKRLMSLCKGRYYGCKQREEILVFHRRLIDSGVMAAR